MGIPIAATPFPFAAVNVVQGGAAQTTEWVNIRTLESVREETRSRRDSTTLQLDAAVSFTFLYTPTVVGTGIVAGDNVNVLVQTTSDTSAGTPATDLVVTNTATVVLDIATAAVVSVQRGFAVAGALLDLVPVFSWMRLSLDPAPIVTATVAINIIPTVWLPFRR